MTELNEVILPASGECFCPQPLIDEALGAAAIRSQIDDLDAIAREASQAWPPPRFFRNSRIANEDDLDLGLESFGLRRSGDRWPGERGHSAHADHNHPNQE